MPPLWLMMGFGMNAWGQTADDVPQAGRHRRTSDLATSASTIEQLRQRYEALLETKRTEVARLAEQLEQREQHEADDADDADTPPTVPVPPGPVPLTAPPVPVRPPPPLEAGDFATPPPVQVGDVVTPPPLPDGEPVSPRAQNTRQGPLVLDVAPRPTRQRVLPVGSYVYGTVLTGAEAPGRVDLPLVIEVERAWAGPNRHRFAWGSADQSVELVGCHIIASVRGNFATARADGEARRLSCVTRGGEAVELPLKGFLVDQDNTFGLRGEVFRRDGGAIAAAILASLVDGVGGALARSREVTQVVPGALGGGATATNVDGSVPYALGTGAASAARRVADWYLERASQLEPVVAVGSGLPVWIVLLEPAPLPRGVTP